MTPKYTLTELKKGPLFLKRDTFRPLISILENYVQSQKTPPTFFFFFFFFCVSLVAHLCTTLIFEWLSRGCVKPNMWWKSWARACYPSDKSCMWPVYQTYIAGWTISSCLYLIRLCCLPLFLVIQRNNEGNSLDSGGNSHHVCIVLVCAWYLDDYVN